MTIFGGTMKKKLYRTSPLFLIIAVVLALVFIGQIALFSNAQKSPVISVDDCVELWMEQEVVNEEMLWTIYAKNNCDRTTTIKRIIHITEAVNVSVDKGEEYDLSKFVILANSTKVVMHIRKIQPNKKGNFKWKLLNQ